MLRKNTIVAELERRYSKPQIQTSVRGGEERDDLDFVPMEMDLTTEGPPPDDRVSLDKEDIRRSFKDKITLYAKLILPHVGLILLLASYTIIGAFVFHFIELPNEIEIRAQEIKTIYGIRNNLLDSLWDLNNNNTTAITQEDFQKAAEMYLDELVTAMYSSYKYRFITDAELRNDSETKLWTLANSIFFATTVITTIGYGNLAPITIYGRMFCIVFGLFGIPLMLVTIANIGKFFSEFLSFLYRHFRVFKRNLRRTSSKFSFLLRSWSRSSSEDKASPMTAEMLNDDSSMSSFDDELRIPVAMLGLGLVAYMALGALLFKNFENWPYFDAFYFCFITMAMIGFGDMVPTEQVYMFFTMAYILFGLALATMCLDLAGMEYIRKIHYLGHKMETAKTVVGKSLVSGVHQGQHLWRDNMGILRTVGGRRIDPRTDELTESMVENHVLYAPLDPVVARAAMKAGIKVLPNQIDNSDGYVLRNRSTSLPSLRQHFQSPNAIYRSVVERSCNMPNDPVILVPPFVMKESYI